MIWTLICIVGLIIGIGLFILLSINCITRHLSWSAESAIEIVAGCATIIFGAALLVIVLCIIGLHAGTDLNIQKVNIYQDSLEQRVEIIDSNYEDVSKSQIIADVAEWNSKVTSDKYWSQNPWTNWFYNAKVVEAEHIIEY